MWGTATVRGEEDVIVRRLNHDEKYCWRTEGPIEGHTLHSNDEITDFVASDWSWLERQSMKNPDNEPRWEWNTEYRDPYYQAAITVAWADWALGPQWARQYGSPWGEDSWIFTVSLGPFHATLTRFWNLR